MQLEALATSLVDAHLTCRFLMPKWRDRDDSESNFMAFVAELTSQVDARAEEELDSAFETNAPDDDLLSPEPVQRASCALEPIGRKRRLPPRQDDTCSLQGRCACRVKKRSNVDRTEGGKGKHAHKTVWRCRVHPSVYVCGTKHRNCLDEHVQDVLNGEFE